MSGVTCQAMISLTSGRRRREVPRATDHPTDRAREGHASRPRTVAHEPVDGGTVAHLTEVDPQASRRWNGQGSANGRRYDPNGGLPAPKGPGQGVAVDSRILGELEATFPSGLVTFLFSDIVGSTALWEEEADNMAAVMARHDAVIGAAVLDRGGVVVKSTGDGLMAAFDDATSGVTAAADVQRALSTEAWAVPITVRTGLHTGPGHPERGDYFGPTVNRAARIAGAAHPGQILISAATAALLKGWTLRDLGEHHLRGIGPMRLQQVLVAGLPTEFPRLATALLAVDLPSTNTTFVGRAADAEAVGRLVESHRLVTLVGAGGGGKTRLAIEVAGRLAGRFPDGVRFADLATVTDSTRLTDVVVRSLGLADDPMGIDPLARLSSYLADRAVLCVLDNCEHVLDASATLSEAVLARPGRTVLLATSREPLGVLGEQVYVVPSLDFGTDAVRLFADRAAEARANFRVDDTQRVTIAQICQRLDGMPLAIELAAARIAHLSPTQLLARLDNRFRLLTGGRRRVERHQTLAATLDWSHDLLEPTHRVALRRLAVFPASFSLEAADAVAGVSDVVESLGSLVAKSLVQVVDDGEQLRYRLLETVRLYAEAKLLDAGEVAECQARHRDWVLDWLESIPFEERWLGDVDFLTGEYPSVRAALELSAAERNLEAVARIASSVDWARSDAWKEGKRWCEEAAAADDLSLNLQAQVYVVLWRVMAMSLRGSTDWSARNSWAQRAIDASVGRASPVHAVALVSRGLGAAVWAAERRDESLARRATAWAEAGIRMIEQFPVPWRMYCRLVTGGTYTVLSLTGLRRAEQAERHYVAGLAEAPPGAPYLGLRAGLCGHLALHRLVSGDTSGAVALAREARVEDARSPLWGWESSLALALVFALGEVGDTDAALQELRAYDTAARRVDWGLGRETVVLYGGVLAALREDWEMASRLLSAGERSVFRSPAIALLYFAFRDRVRAELGPELSRKMRDEGRTMRLADALDAALY
jgi:predicted ATPase/class 3 adenylate cyclase